MVLLEKVPSPVASHRHGCSPKIALWIASAFVVSLCSGPRVFSSAIVSEVTQVLYEVTERQEIKSNLARQLLHLACHAENLPVLKAARMERGL